MIEAHFVQSCLRSIRRDVAADAAFHPIGAHHHGHSVPADNTFDPPLDLPTAWIVGLLFHGNGIDIRRVGGKRQFYPRRVDSFLQLAEEFLYSFCSAMLDDIIQ